MPFRTVDGETHLCLVTVDPDTSVETITFVFPGGDGTSEQTAVEITNFTQLIQADEDSEMQGKYIKVLNDIDMADEVGYLGYTNKYQYQTNIFADTPKKIIGLSVINTGQFFVGYSATKQASLKRVSFVNCVYKPSVATSSFIGSSTTDSTASFTTIEDSSFSVRISPIGANSIRILGSHLVTLNVSVYVEIYGSANIGVIVGSNTEKTRTNVVIDGGIVSQQYPFSGKMRTCSIVLKNCVCNIPSATGTSNDNAMQTYYAFSNCTFSSSPIAAYTNRHNLLATDTTPYPFEAYSSSSNNIIFGTLVDETDPNFETSSIKSKQFLIDSGFLP